MNEIPNQYKKKANSLIYDIEKLSKELWIIVSELGAELHIDCVNYIIIIKKREGGN